MAGIKALSLAASCGAAVFFGAYFVAASPLPTAGVAALVITIVVAGLTSWFLRRHPPSIDPSAETDDEQEPPTSDTYGWEIGTFLVAAIVVPLIVLMGLAVRLFLPLAMIGGFWIVNRGATFVDVLTAAVCCLVVLACVEFGAEAPLCRRWGLPFGEKTPPLKDYCPTPQSGKRRE